MTSEMNEKRFTSHSPALIQSYESFQEDTLLVKTFTWNELKVGDCHQIEGTLIIRSDGSARFDCVTWTDSTHSGDYWWAGFILMDNSRVALHNEPYHQGPRMDDGHPSPRYRWGFDFNFDKTNYSIITIVDQSYKG